MKKKKIKKENIYKSSIWINPIVLIGGFIIFIALIIFISNFHHLHNISGKEIIKVFIFCILIGCFFASIIISDLIQKINHISFRIISSLAIAILMCILLQTGVGVSVIIIFFTTLLGITGPKWIKFVDFL